MDDGGGAGCGLDNTWSVCSKPSGNTTQGLCDMAGNVFEWIQDWYHSSYDDAPTDGSAWETPASAYRVIRGSAYVYFAFDLRAVVRNCDDPDAVHFAIGFRCARQVE